MRDALNIGHALQAFLPVQKEPRRGAAVQNQEINAPFKGDRLYQIATCVLRLGDAKYVAPESDGNEETQPMHHSGGARMWLPLQPAQINTLLLSAHKFCSRKRPRREKLDQHSLARSVRTDEPALADQM